MKSKKGKYLILTLSIFILTGLITILSNSNKLKDNSNLISEEKSKNLIEDNDKSNLIEDNDKSNLIEDNDKSNLIEDNDKSNLIVENYNNNVVTTEVEEDGSVRVLPENKSESIIVLPNPNSDEQVTLKKL